MNPIIENLTGTAAMTDQVIATDLLISAKNGVRNYAIALTECASHDLRTVLVRQLEDAIDAHDQITQYMMDRGWYHAYDFPEQIRIDIQTAQTALNLQ